MGDRRYRMMDQGRIHLSHLVSELSHAYPKPVPDLYRAVPHTTDSQLRDDTKWDDLGHYLRWLCPIRGVTRYGN
jgi:hypothetical protein